MACLTYEEFLAFPLGVEVLETEFSALEFHAAAQIDAVTYGRIDMESPPLEVKKAVALQVAYLAQNGGIDLALGGMALAGENLGSYSYTAGTGQAGGLPAVCPEARSVLWPTGLLYAGVGRRRG